MILMPQIFDIIANENACYKHNELESYVWTTKKFTADILFSVVRLLSVCRSSYHSVMCLLSMGLLYMYHKDFNSHQICSRYMYKKLNEVKLFTSQAIFTDRVAVVLLWHSEYVLHDTKYLQCKYERAEAPSPFVDPCKPAVRSGFLESQASPAWLAVPEWISVAQWSCEYKS